MDFLDDVQHFTQLGHHLVKHLDVAFKVAIEVVTNNSENLLMKPFVLLIAHPAWLCQAEAHFLGVTLLAFLLDQALGHQLGDHLRYRSSRDAHVFGQFGCVGFGHFAYRLYRMDFGMMQGLACSEISRPLLQGNEPLGNPNHLLHHSMQFDINAFHGSIV